MILDHFIQLLNTSPVIIGPELVLSNLCLTISEKHALCRARRIQICSLSELWLGVSRAFLNLWFKLFHYGSPRSMTDWRTTVCVSFNVHTFLIQADTPAWHCSKGKNGTPCMFVFRAWESIKSASCVPLVFRWPWPMGPVAAEPSTCSSESQDLAEPETFLSRGNTCFDLAHTRSHGAEILFRFQKSNQFLQLQLWRVQWARGNGIWVVCSMDCANCEGMTSNLSSDVIRRRGLTVRAI